MSDKEIPDTNPFLSSPDYQAEYRDMLAEQNINELRAIARERGIAIHGNRKEPIVEALASRFGSLHSVRAEIALLGTQPDANDLFSILTYLHLTLPPGYGLSAESIADLLVEKRWAKNGSAVRVQLKKLNRRGLLLSFSHRKVIYWILPQAVRTCLPRRPDLVPACPTDKSGQLQVHKRPSAHSSQMLYTIWEHIAQHHPKRRAPPPRQPIEDEWPQLKEWNHLASEIQDQTSYGTPRGRQTYSSALSKHPLTIPVPAYRLCDIDHELLGQLLPKGSAELQPLAAHASGQTGAGQARNVNEEIDFCYTLLAELDALSGGPGEPILAHKERFQQFLKLAPSEQARTVLRTWTVGATWSEMEIVLRSSDDLRLRRNPAYASYKPSHLYLEWRAGRQAVLRLLSVLEEDRWFSVKGFLKTVYEFAPKLLHTHSDRAVWWIESLKTKKQFGATFDDWQQSCGRFITAILTGPLFWLGAVVLGYANEATADGREPEAFKLTPIGSLVLGQRSTAAESEYQTARGAVVDIREDMTIDILPSHAPAQLHDLLHLIGDLVQATPERFVYRITADGVQEALEQGQTVESIAAALGQLSGSDVPTSWLDRMHTWSENHGKFHVYDDIAVVELADDYALVELLANTSLCDAIVFQFSPRLLAIRPETVDALVQEMEKRGYTPRVE